MAFNTTFYQSPVVLVAANHRYDRKMKDRILPENNIISAWVEVGFLLPLLMYIYIYIVTSF